MATKAAVRAWRGVWMGWVAFLVLAALAYLTPLRLSVLKLAGRDYAVIRLEAATASASSGAPERPDLAARRAAWARDHARLSPFGFVRWADDLWPWLVGLGIALPVLGGFVGAQAGGRNRAAAAPGVGIPGAAPDRLAAPRALRDFAPAGLASSASAGATPIAAVPSSLPDVAPSRAPENPRAAPPETQPEASAEVSPETSAPEAPPLSADPAAWSWNARPAPRAPARPKPPPVISPNGDSL